MSDFLGERETQAGARGGARLALAGMVATPMSFTALLKTAAVSA